MQNSQVAVTNVPLSRNTRNVRKKREIAKRHSLSLILFGSFAPLDFLLLGLFLFTGEGWPIWVRTGLAGIAVYFAQPFSRKENWSSRQALISLTLLLLPGLGGAVGAIWSWIPSRPSGAWEDVPVSPTKIRSKVDWNRLLDVVPMIDVLMDGETSRKKQILLYGQESGSRINVPVVRLGLLDPDPEVRYYAAALINRMEMSLSAEIARLEQQLADDRTGSQTWNSLAKAYWAVVEEGIAGHELGRFYQEKRLRALEQSLAIEPDQPVAAVERAETLLALGRRQDAVAAAEALLSSPERARAAGVLLAVVYDSNDQRQIDRLCAQIHEPDKLPPEVRGLLELYRERWERSDKDEKEYAKPALYRPLADLRDRDLLADQPLCQARTRADEGGNG